MVIPRSFSSSPQSKRRSSFCWSEEQAFKSWSTNVVLPWSTWATMIEHAFVRQDFFQMFIRHYLVDIPMMATFLTPNLRQVAREESADSEFVSVATEVEKYRVRLRKAFTFWKGEGAFPTSVFCEESKRICELGCCVEEKMNWWCESASLTGEVVVRTKSALERNDGLGALDKILFLNISFNPLEHFFVCQE